MDSRIEEKAKELAELIYNSQDYKNYLSCREVLRKDTELYQKANEFRRKNFLLQVEEDADKLYDEVGRLKDEYASVHRDMRVTEFLQSEDFLCRTLQQIDKILLEKLDFDLEFLEENHD